MRDSNGELILSDERLSVSEIEQVLALDSLVYKPEYCSDFEQVLNRFNKNKDSFITLRKNEEIIAYICFFPITKHLADMIISEKYTNDSEILSHDVLAYEDAEGILYVISVVVSPEYQSSEAIKLVMNAFEVKIHELSSLYNLKSILATAISKKGQRTLIISDFQVVWTNQEKSICVMERLL